MNKIRIISTTVSVIVLTGLILGAAAYSHQMAADKAGQSGTVIKRPVLTETVKAGNSNRKREFPGIVRASRRVELAFSVSGKLIELPVREGKSFKQGDILGKLDTRDFESALQIARANFLEAQATYERKQDLFAKAVIPAAELDHARAIRDMSEGEMAIRKKALEDTILLAPFDGVVARRYVENHEHIQATEPVVSFQDIDTLEIQIQLSERLIAEQGRGFLNNLSVRFESDPKKRSFDGIKIDEYRLQADPATGTFDVILKMKAPESLYLYPGMTAKVEADFPGEENSESERKAGLPELSRIPVQAVLTDPLGNAYVWAVNEEDDTAISKIQVEPVHAEGDHLLIRSTLQPGRRVVTSGGSQLREYMRILNLTDKEERLGL